jgi:hypothetical protein
MGTGSFPGGRKQPGRDVDPSPPSSAEVYKQSRAIPLPSLRAFVACKRKAETYLEPNGYCMYNQSLFFKNSTFCPHTIEVFCVDLRTNKMISVLL